MATNKSSGPIHPIFNLLLNDDLENDFNKLAHIEQSLGEVMARGLKKKDRNHLIAEIIASEKINSLNSLFELATMAFGARLFDDWSATNYPATLPGRGVELLLQNDGRSIYFEATVLSESDADRDRWARIINKNLPPQAQSLDMDYYATRLVSRIEEKTHQFLPSQPNILFLSVFDMLTNKFIIDQALAEAEISNIGHIVLFNRFTFDHIISDGCDPKCQLDDSELQRLSASLEKGDFPNFIYN
jgi:hypothetical protein